jgi:type II secretory pathway component GspD/PulD (secretin)
VRSVEVTQTGDQLSVHIVGDHLSKPCPVATYQKQKLTFEWSAKLEGKSTTIPVTTNDVASVWYGWFSARPCKVRMQIRTKHPMQPRIEPTSDGWTVTVGSAPEVIKPKKTNKKVTTAKNATAKKAAIKKSSVKTAMKPTPIDAFPTTVPPLTPIHKPSATTEVVALTIPAPRKAAPAGSKTDAGGRHVSLECTNANLTQILKGLALQSGENIIIGPGLEKMSVSADLHEVTIDQALDYVCSLTGAKYARVEGTYVVSPDAPSFQRAMTSLINRSNQTSIVRVVPIASGACGQVESALDKWFSPGTLKVVVPGENGDKDSPDASAAAAGAPAASGTASAPAAAPASSGSSGKDVTGNYIILIGEPKWVDAGERVAKEVDERIVQAKITVQQQQHDNETQAETVRMQELSEKAKASEDLMMSMAPVVRSYQVQNGAANDLKEALVAQGGAANVSMVASPKDSLSQVIVLQGTNESVDRAYSLLRQLDAGGDSDTTAGGDELYSYDVKFADPRSLREAVISQVPGLRAILPPNNVGNVNLYKPEETKKESNDVSSNNLSQNQSNQQSESSGGGSGSLGSSSGAVQTTEVSDGQFEIPFTKEEAQAVPMRLLLRGSHALIQQALKYLEVLDVPIKQVAIELRVMDLSKQDAINAGIDWNIISGGAVKILNLNNAQSTPSNTIGVSISGNNFNGDVTASLDRITSKTNLIARPNIVAMDGRQSEIFVGDIVRYIESETTSQNGPTITTGEVPVGVRLSILPRVGADGNLTLDLRPRVSILDSFTQVPGGGELPQTSSRMAQSTLSLKSGETIAIGGLIQDEDVKNISGIPILMDLPFLGHLFKKTSNSKQRSEVVIFLTAREIDGPVGSQSALPMMKEVDKDDKENKDHKGGSR